MSTTFFMTFGETEGQISFESHSLREKRSWQSLNYGRKLSKKASFKDGFI